MGSELGLANPAPLCEKMIIPLIRPFYFHSVSLVIFDLPEG